ncbi:MAG: hypothetical protein CVU56_11420 [Deltaproteobacteria bacterium HGW-Deltaproteobacteria-14]|jgi:hypothetical protein|nr:MAG: hypothetical protein CVU56_11420 [Deltaproteobacteria bacterium HGW-Deltaproteobacteria-14]
MTRFLAVLLTVAYAVPASAAEPAPILDDRGSATRLAPEAGGFDDPAAVIEKKGEPEEPLVADREWSLVTLHSRWVTVPSFVLDLLFVDHTEFSNVAAGVGYEFGARDRYMWVFEFDWTPITPVAGNWRTDGDPPAGASYVESGMHLLSVDVSYRRQVPFTDDFRFFIGGGLGVGLLVGDLTFAEVLPTCEEPVASCAHWRSATSEAADLPTRVIPILTVTTGFELDIADTVMVRLEAGFRDLLFAGLTVGMKL